MKGGVIVVETDGTVTLGRNSDMMFAAFEEDELAFLESPIERLVSSPSTSHPETFPARALSVHAGTGQSSTHLKAQERPRAQSQARVTASGAAVVT